MYSRYSNISIPKNYGGSRFSDLDEPETKTHRASSPISKPKSSHSPSFVPMRVQDEAPVETPEIEEYEELTEDEATEPTILDTEPAKDENEHSSALKALLSGLERDELILLGLILLLISDSSKNNTDIIVMLALLLVNGK